jgi:hypothetical protein
MKIKRGFPDKGGSTKVAGGVGPRWCQMVNTPAVDKLNQQLRSFQLLKYPPAMAYQTSSPSWLAAVLALFSIFSLLVPANALYFYVDGRQTKCFFEDLPKDTLVAGTVIILQSCN